MPHRAKISIPTPSPKPSQTGKADSCLLFWHGADSQKTLGNDGQTLSHLDDDEKGISLIDTLGGEW